MLTFDCEKLINLLIEEMLWWEALGKKRKKERKMRFCLLVPLLVFILLGFYGSVFVNSEWEIFFLFLASVSFSLAVPLLFMNLVDDGDRCFEFARDLRIFLEEEIVSKSEIYIVKQ